MATETLSPYEWATLLVVGGPATFFSALSFLAAMRTTSRKEIAEGVVLRQDVDGLKAKSEHTSATLDQHLLDCAGNQARLEEAQKTNHATLSRLEQSVVETQRLVVSLTGRKETRGP